MVYRAFDPGYFESYAYLGSQIRIRGSMPIRYLERVEDPLRLRRRVHHVRDVHLPFSFRFAVTPQRIEIEIKIEIELEHNTNIKKREHRKRLRLH